MENARSVEITPNTTLLQNICYILFLESVRIGYGHVTPKTHDRSVRVTFDCIKSLERHVTNISRTTNYHYHSIGRSRYSLQQGRANQNAMVNSRIDSCNNLLNGLSMTISEKIQLVQNACARIRFDQNQTISRPISWSCAGFLL